MPGGTAAQDAAAVVAKGAAGKQEQVGSTPRVVRHRNLVAIPAAGGHRLHSLGAGLWSKAVRVLLAVAMLSLADMLAVHALRQVTVIAGSGVY